MTSLGLVLLVSQLAGAGVCLFFLRFRTCAHVFWKAVAAALLVGFISYLALIARAQPDMAHYAIEKCGSVHCLEGTREEDAMAMVPVFIALGAVLSVVPLALISFVVAVVIGLFKRRFYLIHGDAKERV